MGGTRDGSERPSGRLSGRPEEQPEVRTTIVGGRPPGSGRGRSAMPRGYEILVKKASVDFAFRARLLAERSKAAAELDLALDPTEAAMLDLAPEAHLAAVIDRVRVPERLRGAFMGKVAAVMLAALGLSGCQTEVHPVEGIRPDFELEEPEPAEDEDDDAKPDANPRPDAIELPIEPPPDRDHITRGIRPDRPEPPDFDQVRDERIKMKAGIPPDRTQRPDELDFPVSLGSRPDLPGKGKDEDDEDDER